MADLPSSTPTLNTNNPTPAANPAGPVAPAAMPAIPALPPAGQPASLTPGATPLPGATPTPGATPKPGDTPSGAKTPEQKMVPITALHEEREKHQQLQSEIENLQKLVGDVQNPAAAPVSTQPQQPGNPQEIQHQMDRMWEEDPRKAVQAEIMRAFSWYDQVNASIDTQADALSGKYADFNTYRSSVQKYVRSLPPEQRAKPGVMELAYYIVRGQNVDSIVQNHEQALVKKFQSGEFVGGGSPTGAYSNPNVPQGTQLTQEQQTAAAAMGMSNEDYVKNIKVVV